MELINQTEYFGAENYIDTKAKGLEIFTGPVGRVQIASSGNIKTKIMLFQ